MLSSLLLASLVSLSLASFPSITETHGHLLSDQEIEFFTSNEYEEFVKERQLYSSTEPSNNTDDIDFLLWTRNNWFEEDVLIIHDADSIAYSHFDPTKPTKVLVHGWTDNGRAYWVKHMRDAFLGKGLILLH